MPTRLALVLLLGAVATVYLMVFGCAALWSRKFQLIGGGRTVVGPLAQLCGLLSLAPLVLCLISRGELSYGLGVRTRPDPSRVVAEVGGADDWQHMRAEGKQLLLGMAGDFSLLGIPCVMIVWAVVVTRGIRPARRQRPKVVQSKYPQSRDPDFL
jgi:hypothetical protein